MIERASIAPFALVPAEAAAAAHSRVGRRADALTEDALRSRVREMEFDAVTGATTAQDKYGAIGEWDVSKVSNFFGLFSGDNAFFANFEADLSKWDTSSATSMWKMFSGAKKFESNLSGWDVSKVINMKEMFMDARAFNSDLSRWNTSSVTNTAGMFQKAWLFNSDLSKWDVQGLVQMNSMFQDAWGFNQDISVWRFNEATPDVTDAFEGNSFSACVWDAPGTYAAEDGRHSPGRFYCKRGDTQLKDGRTCSSSR